MTEVGAQVTAYVPARAPEGVVFAGDGGWQASRLAAALDGAEVPSTLVVAVHWLADDKGRLEEYVPVVRAERLAAPRCVRHPA